MTNRTRVMLLLGGFFVVMAILALLSLVLLRRLIWSTYVVNTEFCVPEGAVLRHHDSEGFPYISREARSSWSVDCPTEERCLSSVACQASLYSLKIPIAPREPVDAPEGPTPLAIELAVRDGRDWWFTNLNDYWSLTSCYFSERPGSVFVLCETDSWTSDPLRWDIAR